MLVKVVLLVHMICIVMNTHKAFTKQWVSLTKAWYVNVSTIIIISYTHASNHHLMLISVWP